MRLIEIPPVRRLFKAREGYVLFEADMRRADPQVCAKESGEDALLQAFRENQDIYSGMARWLYKTDKITQEQRQWNKNAINGIDYGAQGNTMARTLHTTLPKAEAYIERWRGESGLYPGIGRWHRKIDRQLRATRTIRNVYGFRRFYTARFNELLPQALAWVCSSAVSITINRSMKHVFGPTTLSDDPDDEDNFDPWSGERYIGLPAVELLLQIHDSILCQIPRDRAEELLPRIVQLMQVEIPYPEPLVIPVTLKVGLNGEAWGDLKTWEPPQRQAA